MIKTKTWKLADEAASVGIVGASYLLEINGVNAKLLEEKFGESGMCDPCKQTYDYVFTNGKDYVSIYDYDKEDGHVGAHTMRAAKDFEEWFRTTHLS